MKRVLLAELAILLQREPFRVIVTVLRRRVIALLAITTFKGDNNSFLFFRHNNSSLGEAR